MTLVVEESVRVLAITHFRVNGQRIPLRRESCAIVNDSSDGIGIEGLIPALGLYLWALSLDELCVEFEEWIGEEALYLFTESALTNGKLRTIVRHYSWLIYGQEDAYYEATKREIENAPGASPCV